MLIQYYLATVFVTSALGLKPFDMSVPVTSQHLKPCSFNIWHCRVHCESKKKCKKVEECLTQKTKLSNSATCVKEEECSCLQKEKGKKPKRLGAKHGYKHEKNKKKQKRTKTGNAK